MKSEFLKLAGVKTEKAFYKKYPTEAAFFKAHPEAKKLMPTAQVGYHVPNNSNFGVNAINNYMMNSTIPNAIPSFVDGMGEGQMGIDPSEYTSYMSDELTPLNTRTMDVMLPNQAPMSFPTITNTPPVPGAEDKSKTPDLGKLVGAGIGGFQAIKQQKKNLAKAKQMSGLTDLYKQASAIREEAPERRYVRPEDAIVNPNQVFPTYGVGTNVLAKNGTEIQNTFAPNTLYDDLGYEPLYETERMKQYQFGGILNSLGSGAKSLYGQGKDMYTQGKKMFSKDSLTDFTKQGGLDKISGTIYPDMNESGTAQIGGGIGEAAGTAIGGPIGGAIGKFAGQTIGRAVDPYQGKIKKEKQQAERNISAMMINNGAVGLQNQNRSYMQDGGIIPNPQVISMFGEYTPEDVYDYAHDGLDSLRAGGHLQSYEQPSQRALQTYAMGGNLKTHWGGYAEEYSQNPYLPGTGETVMFRGQSHEDSDGKGNTGIGITYGGNPVEVERGEPMVELQEGGNIDPMTGQPETSGVVFGNLKIPNEYVELFNDSSAKGKKFKNYVADLSKQENKNNKIIEKNTLELDELDVTNPFDKLKLNALEANISGANSKLKDIADKKIKAANLQNAINDTAEEFGLDADHLAKGKIKINEEVLTPIGKNGVNVAKAGGTYTKEDYNNIINQIANQKGVNPTVIKRLINKESGFSTKETSDRNAKGIMQLTNRVAKQYGVQDIIHSNKPEDIKKVISAGVDYYKTLLKENNGDYVLASAAYNGGPRAINFVKRKLNKNNITGKDWVNFMTNRRQTSPTKDVHAWQNETYKYVRDLHPEILNLPSGNVNTVTNQTTQPSGITETTEKVVKNKPTVYNVPPKGKGYIGYNKVAEVPEWQGENYEKVWKPEVHNMVTDTKLRDQAISLLENYEGPYANEVKGRLAKGKTAEEKAAIIEKLATDSKFGPFHDAVRNVKNIVTTPPTPVAPATTDQTTTVPATPEKVVEKKVPPTSNDGLVNLVNQAIPYFRPSDAEALDTNQLLGEMYALGTNQLEPVQAQGYQPDLITPYDVSFQDAINENTADYRAQQRMFGYNPAAQAALNAQKYTANQKILGEQFRANQAQRMGVYNQNINTLNDARLKNLAIYDQQYDRQAAAKANTKATTQAALNSISSKYLQNDAANRKLQVYENLYNYRFDPQGRAVNVNPLAQFNTSGATGGNNSFLPIIDAQGNTIGWKPREESSDKEKTKKQSVATPPIMPEGTTAAKNGKKVKGKTLNSTIVKAIKNL